MESFSDFDLDGLEWFRKYWWRDFLKKVCDLFFLFVVGLEIEIMMVIWVVCCFG